MPIFSCIVPPQEIDRKWANWNAGHVVIRRQTDNTFAACVNGNWTLVSAKNVLLYIIWNAHLYREADTLVGPRPLGYKIWPQGAPWARFDAKPGCNVFPAPRGSEIATPLALLLCASDMGKTYRAPGATCCEEKRVSAQNERCGRKLEQDDTEFDFVTLGFTNWRAEKEALAENEVEGVTNLDRNHRDIRGPQNSRSIAASDRPEPPGLQETEIDPENHHLHITAQFSAQPCTTPKELDATKASSKQDIITYLGLKLGGLRSQKPVLLSWPEESAIEQMGEHVYAICQFSWASTTLSNLDKLYALAVRVSPAWGAKSSAEEARLVLGSVVHVRIPMITETLDTLLGFERGKSAEVLEGLVGVIRWAPYFTACKLHSTFGECVTDPARSGGAPWFTDLQVLSQ
ncbi:hypothetical protein B0H19DRAFT_1065681 [Mycena capillaripes]|nr:hypothetical protein B0H19DRAFT_1065681 [Mycena capillaripes]